MKYGKLALAAALYLVLGIWKGYVALYEAGATEPMCIYPYAVTSLPEADQAALEDGVIIRNSTQLEQALEDYLS